jgi:hypothetical protein
VGRPIELTVPDGSADGVIIAQGSAYAGWSLYIKHGRPKYCYNLFGVQHFYVEGETEIPSGTHQVRMEFAYEGGGVGKGGDVVLYVDGKGRDVVLYVDGNRSGEVTSAPPCP